MSDRVQCDKCGRQHDPKYPNRDPVNFTVHNHFPRMHDRHQVDLSGPLHFCSPDCLRGWAQDEVEYRDAGYRAVQAATA